MAETTHTDAENSTETIDTDALGRADPWQERAPGLPSDLACAVCGGVVESGEQCLELRHGRNLLGEFREGDRPACVVCLDCADA